MGTLALRPAEGRRVRLPDGTLVPDAGAELELDQFVMRRMADGDLVLVEETKKGASK
jgi:hypothetical protein